MFSKRTRALIAVLLSLMMALSLTTGFVFPVFAEGETVSFTGLADCSALPDIAGGLQDGVTEYQVADRAGLEKLSELCAAGNLEGYSFFQTADIDMEGVPFAGIGTNRHETDIITTTKGVLENVWDWGYAFGASYDGNGFVIQNLFVQGASANRANGLFNAAIGGALRNIGIANGLVVGVYGTAALIGESKDVSVINCWNAATVIGQGRDADCGVAGLIAEAYGETAIVNSYNLGMIVNTGSTTAAGICGYMENGTVQNCYNAGELICGFREMTDEARLPGFNALYSANAESGVAAANNFYRTGCGQYSYKDAAEAGLTELSDNAEGKTEAEFASLAAALNGGANTPDSLGGAEGYTVEFADAEYPAIAYRIGGEIAVKRLPGENAENTGRDDWSAKSGLFALLKENRGTADGAALMTAAKYTVPNVQIATPLDLTVLGAMTYKNTAFGIETIEFTADLDMSENKIPYSVPLFAEMVGVSGAIVVEGNNHIIYNWKSRSTTYYEISARGGLFGEISGDIRNLGMLNARTELDVHPVFSRYDIEKRYTYPALMVGREVKTNASITNCFAVGEIHILHKNAVNDNKNGGIVSQAQGGGFSAKNCWTDVTVYKDYDGDSVPAPARAIGGGVTLSGGALDAVFYVKRSAASLVFNSGEAAYDNAQTALNISDPYELAYTLYNGMNGAFWSVKNENVVFADSDSQTHKLEVSVSGEPPAEEYFGNAGDQIDLIAQYSDEVRFEVTAGDAAALENGVFTFFAGDAKVKVTYPGVNFTHVQRIFDKYKAFDPALFTDEHTLAEILVLSEDFLADRDGLTEEDVKYLDDLVDGFELKLKDRYPYYVPYALADTVYAQFETANYAIVSKEDWLAAVGSGSDFRGITLHFINDIDMGNTAMLPMNYGATFAGTINGHDHVIKNILIDMELREENETLAPIGLVSNLTGTIRNLGIESGAINVLYDVEKDSYGVAAFAGISSGDVIFCWNGADVTVRVESVYDYNWNASVSAIVGRSGDNKGSIVNCYNLGTITAPAASGKGTHAAAFNDWMYSINIYNCFNYGTLVAASGGRRLMRINGGRTPDLVNIVDVSGTADRVANDLENETTVKMDPAAYSNGELAWTLNHNYVEGKGEVPNYTVKDGKTVFGEAGNKTCRILVKASGQKDAAYYWNAGTSHKIDLPDGTYMTVTAGSALIDGDIITVSEDAEITVRYSGLNLRYVQSMLQRYLSYDQDLFTDASDLNALIAAAQAILDHGESAGDAEFNALIERENALQLTLRNEYPNLVPFAKRDTLYRAYATDDYAISTKEDWLAAGEAEGDFSGVSLHFTNDVDMENTAMLPLAFGEKFRGEIDGHGYVMKNVLIDMELRKESETLAPVGLVSNLVGTVRNLGIESGAINVLYDVTQDNYGVGALAGVSSGDLIFCWNGADVAIRLNSVYDYNWNASVSGIAGRSGSDNQSRGSIVNCYNIGTITAPNAAGKSTHAAAFNDWLYSTKVYNSFNYGTLIANRNGRRLARVSTGYAPDFTNVIDASGTTDSLVNLYASQTTIRMSSASYATGELAWKLNQNYVEGKGDAPYYTVEDGKTVFGTANTQTRKVSFIAGAKGADLYTDSNGNLIGLTDEILEMADWDYPGNLARAAFREDTVINGEPCPHNWEYVYAGNGKHRKTCTLCEKTVEEDCTVEYVYDGGDTHTHSGVCTLCGNTTGETKIPCDEADTTVDFATHTAPEVIHHACSVCGNAYDEAVGNALGHTWSPVWVHQGTTFGAASCHMKTCTANDGGEWIEACTFVDEVVAPGYLANGYTRHTCVVCGYYYDTDIVPMLVNPGLILTGGRVKAGKTITVPLALANNDGLAGMTIQLDYDTAALHLTEVTAVNDKLTVNGPVDGAPQIRVSMAAAENITSGARDILLNLTFTVSENAEGEYPIIATVIDATRITGTAPETYAQVDVLGANTTVTVYTNMWGDVDGDKQATVLDATKILQYLIKKDVEINLTAADINGDRAVTLDDAIYLMRYLAGFENELG